MIEPMDVGQTLLKVIELISAVMLRRVRRTNGYLLKILEKEAGQ